MRKLIEGIKKFLKPKPKPYISSLRRFEAFNHVEWQARRTK